jgi:hypothetical protein
VGVIEEGVGCSRHAVSGRGELAQRRPCGCAGVGREGGREREREGRSMAELESESRRAFGEGHGCMTSRRLLTGFDVFLLNSGRRASSCPTVMPATVNAKIRWSILFNRRG